MYEQLMELYDEYSDGEFGVKLTVLEDKSWEVMASCDGMDLLPAFVVKSDDAKAEVRRFMEEVFTIISDVS